MTCTEANTYSQEADSSGACNYLASHTGLQVVSDRVETYNGTHCEGIVNQVYMGDPNKTAGVTGLPPLLPPGEHQKILESTLDALNTIPRWLKSDCLTSMRIAFCSATFLEPVTKTDLVPYGFGTVPMPRFPQYSMCTDYKHHCANPLATLFADIPSLHLDCNTTVVDTQGLVRVYPAEAQVVAYVPLSTSLTVYIATEPSYSNASVNFAVDSQCPFGFEDIYHTPIEERPYTVNMLSESTPSSTNCVYQCPTKIVAKEDLTELNVLSRAATFITFLMTTISVTNLAILWYKKGENPIRNQFSAVNFLSFILSTLTGITMIATSPEPSSRVCSSDTTWYRFGTLGSNWIGIGAYGCFFEAILGGIHLMAVLDLILMIAVELYMRTVLKYSNSTVSSAKAILRIFSLCFHHVPRLVALCLAGRFVPDKDTSSYNGITNIYTTLTICEYESGNNLIDTFLLFVPILISYVFSTCIFLYTLVHCIRISYRALKLQSENPLWDLWKSYKFLIVTNAAFVTYFTFVLFIWFFYYSADANINFVQNWIKYRDAIKSYYTCLISGFTNLEVDPSGGKARCSIAEINDLKPMWSISLYFIVRAITDIWYPMSTWSEYAASVYWHALPIPLRNIIKKAMDRYQGKKVLPIANTVEEASASDMELAELKLKSKSSPDIEETKSIEAN